MELRSLELDDIYLTVRDLTSVVQSCPLLEVLRVRNCVQLYKKDEQDLRAKFARIKTLKLERDDIFRYSTKLPPVKLNLPK